MATGSERYRKHKDWETLQFKRESLDAARFDDKKAEQKRTDIVEWLTEAEKSNPRARQKSRDSIGRQHSANSQKSSVFLIVAI